jgi:hypothetical protein
MTKETMIWQTLSAIIAGMVNRKDIPETKELFEKQVIEQAQTTLDYSYEEIKEVLYTTDCTGFAKLQTQLFSVPIANPIAYDFGKNAVGAFLSAGCPNYPKDERGSWLKWYDNWFLKNQPKPFSLKERLEEINASLEIIYQDKNPSISIFGDGSWLIEIDGAYLGGPCRAGGEASGSSIEELEKFIKEKTK